MSESIFRETNDALVGGARFLLNVEGTRFQLRWCPPGKFVMGSKLDSGLRWDDEICHEVKLTSGFFIGETQVTQMQWASVMAGETVYDLAKKGLLDNHEYDLNGTIQTLRQSWGMDVNDDPTMRCCDLMDSAPVYNISWFEADSFCEQLKNMIYDEFKNEDWVVRLPTEAEWEYACRAGSEFALSNGYNLFGDVNEYENDKLDDIAWYGGNSYKEFLGRGWNLSEIIGEKGEGRFAGPHPVGTKLPNAWGLYDMHGNVWEWCSDWYGAYDEDSVIDPKGPLTGCKKIVRGGGCLSSPRSCRASNRGSYDPGRKSRSVGMRFVFQEVAK